MKYPVRLTTSRTLLSGAVAAFLYTTPLAAQTDTAATLDTSAESVISGDFRDAIDQWSPVITTMREGRGKASAESSALVGTSLAKLLLRRGEAFMRLGFYNRSNQDLTEALSLAEQLKLPVLQSMVIGSLGDLHAAAQHNSTFRGPVLDPAALFEQSFSLAADSGLQALISVAGVRLGNWYLNNGDVQLGFATLEDASFRAETTNSLLLRADARVHYARAARLQGYGDDVPEILREATRNIEAMPAGFSSAELFLDAGREALQVGDATANNIGVPAFEKVIAMAGSLSDMRLVGVAFGELGDWYRTSGDDIKAVEMFERAVGVSADAHDLAIDWEWQLATLYRDRDDFHSAVSAYRRAIRHIDRIRDDIPVSYSDGRSSFQVSRGPIYLELADLLMRQADSADTFDGQQALLSDTVAVMEELKRSELQDYFRDTCVIEQSSSVGSDSADSAAVVYPVILENRLAMLLTVDGVTHQYSTDVTEAQLHEEVSLLAALLRQPATGGAFLTPAEQVYDWVIAPMAEQLQKSGADTLFFVPDGVLRTIPLSVLWDGEQFLIDNYEIASAPGLTLLNAEPLQNTRRRTLVAGLSLPGESVPKLPDDYYEEAFDLISGDQSGTTRGAVAVRSATSDEKIRKWLELPAVAQEVELPASHKLPSKVLLDENFSYETFKQEILERPYQIVHVASHGFFGENVDDSWIMTHDELIDLGELSSLFKPKEFSEDPIELLVLSACSTAEGNDLAPLGLAGVALTSGARSVIGSLWSVPDDATKQLMDGFYKGISVSGVSKAGALRQAQLGVLEENRRLHPFYWAAFTLMGNWL